MSFELSSARYAFPSEEEMARRRWQAKGHLYKERGYWKLRYWEDTIDKDGALKRKRSRPQYLGPCEGPAALTQKQAFAMRDKIMAKVNVDSHQPQSLLTIKQFVEERFEKEHVATLTRAGKRHYGDTLKHVVGAFGEIPLRDLKKHHVQRLLLLKAERGLSRSFITQIRNTIHTVYQYAEDCEFFTGRNPARRVRIPAEAKRPEKITGYTVEQFQKVIARLQSPLREMFVLGAATSMHGAELAGLRIRHLNLSAESKTIEGAVVGPWALLVCENVYRNSRGETKNRHRRRKLPIPPGLRSRLVEMIGSRDPEEPVFLMPATLRRQKHPPIDTHNIQNRVLRPLGKTLGFPVSWHRVRHSNATWTAEMLGDDKDRAAMMGHWSPKMTAHYTDDFERRRRLADAIESKVMGEPVGGVV